MSQKQGPISPIYNQKQGGCEYYKEGSAVAAQRGKIYYIGLLLSSLCSVFLVASCVMCLSAEKLHRTGCYC